MMDERIPVYIVTGFLGAGKTTLLRQALKEPELHGTLLLVNEVAEIGVDDRLIRLSGADTVLLPNGCLCCTASENLGATLQGVVESESFKGVQRIIVETTGLADPLPVISTIAINPFLTARLRVELVLTVVDALHADECEADSTDYGRQVQAADVVLMSKTDLATSAQTEAAHRKVARLNPLASCQPATARHFAELMLHPSDQRADKLATSGLFSELVEMDAPSIGGAIPGYDARMERSEGRRTRLRLGARPLPASHSLQVRSFCLELGEDLDWVRLSIWLSLLLHRHGANILRVKGFLALENRSSPVVINCVHHVIYFPEHLSEWPEGDRKSSLVFITRDLSPDLVLRSLLACVRPA